VQMLRLRDELTPGDLPRTAVRGAVRHCHRNDHRERQTAFLHGARLPRPQLGQRTIPAVHGALALGPWERRHVLGHRGRPAPAERIRLGLPSRRPGRRHDDGQAPGRRIENAQFGLGSAPPKTCGSSSPSETTGG
jgi:hypothetical protein